MKKEQIKQTFPTIEMFFDEPLMNYTFTKTGGPADVLIFPKNTKEVVSVINYCNEKKLEWIVLGNASNLIVRDGGIREVVIMLTHMKNITIEKERICVEAGAQLIDTTHVALENSLTGFEFACGIPGSVGGAVFMNAGAYEGEIKDIFVSCEYLLPDGSIVTKTAKEMNFSYRHSSIQQSQGIVLSATFSLHKGNYDEIKEKMTKLTSLRESKQPLEYPSCGSVFQRPKGYYTGALIQDAGLQGFQLGGAQISEKHAGFIVNIDHATATDYIELIAHIQETILEKFGVALEPEVRIIGEEIK